MNSHEPGALMAQTGVNSDGQVQSAHTERVVLLVRPQSVMDATTPALSTHVSTRSLRPPPHDTPAPVALTQTPAGIATATVTTGL